MSALDAATAGAGRPLRPALFVDKDGTLVDDVPYNVDPARLVFTPYALEGLRALADAGFAIVVVTNQPGLATGRFSRHDFAALELALRERLRREGGVEVAALYCCPHAPAHDGRITCVCRKPAPGLLRQAARALDLDLAASWMVGDILDDVEAGHRAGCRAVLLDVGNETVWRTTPARLPDARCADLGEAARVILAHRAARASS